MNQQTNNPVLPFEIEEDHTNNTISITVREPAANEPAPNQSFSGPVRRTKQKAAANLAATASTQAAVTAQSAEDKAAGRIRISPTAVAAFEYVYAIERKPNEALIRVLSQSFGETFARVKVWFQNRRGRDTREKGGSSDESGPASAKRPHQLPSSVLQTLLSQQKQQNPNLANELQQSLAASTGSSDLASTTAQALNAMLTVSSISKFWGHHNHLLAGELITQEGERLNLEALKEDERVMGSPLMLALLERVIELRQGVIDQFVMTDNLIREALPLEKTEADHAESTRAQGILLQPIPLGFASACPGLPEMNWETMGYAPFFAHPPSHQFPYGDINHGHQQQHLAQHWEFVHEDGSRPSMLRPSAQAHLASHMMMSRMSPSPPPTSTLPAQLAPLRPRTPQDNTMSPLNEMDYFLDDIDPRILPVKSWILENLLKALKKSASTVADGINCDELQETQTTAHFSPADFHRLNTFLSLHESSETDAAIRVSVASTLEGHAGWLLSGEDFVRVLPVPLDTIFGDLKIEASARFIDIVQVYLLYDLKQHIITIKPVYTLSK